MAPLTIQGLQADLPFGARVKGVTSSALEDAAVRAELRQALKTEP